MLAQTIVDSRVGKIDAGLSGETRQFFLLTLQKDPERVVAWVMSNLLDWLTIECFQCGEVIAVYDSRLAAKQIVEELRKRFAEELAKSCGGESQVPMPA